MAVSRATVRATAWVTCGVITSPATQIASREVPRHRYTVSVRRSSNVARIVRRSRTFFGAMLQVRRSSVTRVAWRCCGASKRALRSSRHAGRDQVWGGRLWTGQEARMFQHMVKIDVRPPLVLGAPRRGGTRLAVAIRHGISSPEDLAAIVPKASLWAATELASLQAGTGPCDCASARQDLEEQRNRVVVDVDGVGPSGRGAAVDVRRCSASWRLGRSLRINTHVRQVCAGAGRSSTMPNRMEFERLIGISGIGRSSPCRSCPVSNRWTWGR